MIGILSVFAQLEKDQITERFTMGRIGRSKAGYYHGGAHPPTGYDYKDGQLVVNEYEAIQVREIFRLFVSGRSINSIERELTRQYTTRWSATKVLSVLRNTIYIGRVKFRKTEYTGVHQPLIDESLFWEADRLLKSSEREEKKTTAQKTPYRAGYMLSGLIYCAKCGARYSASHGYYICYSRSKNNKKFVVDPNCMNDKWKIADLDAVVCRHAEGMISRTDLLEFAAAMSEEKRQEIDWDAIAARITEIEGQVTKLLDLYQVGNIPIETITTRINALTAEKEKMREILNQRTNTPAIEHFLAAIDAYKAGFQTGDTAARRLFLSSLIERVIVDGQSVNIKWRL